MSEHARALVELVDHESWTDLGASERALFDLWLAGATGVDLYLLLDHARTTWRRRRTSSSPTLDAIARTGGDDDG